MRKMWISMRNSMSKGIRSWVLSLNRFKVAYQISLLEEILQEIRFYCRIGNYSARRCRNSFRKMSTRYVRRWLRNRPTRASHHLLDLIKISTPLRKARVSLEYAFMRWQRSALSSRNPPLNLRSCRKKRIMLLCVASILSLYPPRRQGNPISTRLMTTRTFTKYPLRSSMWVSLRTTSLILISTMRDDAVCKNSWMISSVTSRKLR